MCHCDGLLLPWPIYWIHWPTSLRSWKMTSLICQCHCATWWQCGRDVGLLCKRGRAGKLVHNFKSCMIFNRYYWHFMWSCMDISFYVLSPSCPYECRQLRLLPILNPWPSQNGSIDSRCRCMIQVPSIHSIVLWILFANFHDIIVNSFYIKYHMGMVGYHNYSNIVTFIVYMKVIIIIIINSTPKFSHPASNARWIIRYRCISSIWCLDHRAVCLLKSVDRS